jgi:hypothetical protein
MTDLRRGCKTTQPSRPMQALADGRPMCREPSFAETLPTMAMAHVVHFRSMLELQ